MILPPDRTGYRVTALLEALKGALVLIAGIGLLSLVHKDMHEAAAALVRHLHLNPAKHFPRIFLDLAENMNDSRLWALAAGAAVYSTVRMIEAYGLWYERQWAAWFGVLSGAMYLPVEIVEAVRDITWPRVAVLVTNLIVVLYLALLLIHGRKTSLRAGTTDEHG